MIRAFDPATHPKGCDCADCCRAAKAAGACTCGSDATSLNPAEVVVHRHDGQPCYVAEAAS